MSHWNTRRVLVGFGGSFLALGLLMGQGCPGPMMMPWVDSYGWNSQNGSSTSQPWDNVNGWGMMGGYGPGYDMMWNNGDWGNDQGWGPGGLLYQTFASSPITATFTSAQTNRAIDIVVSGNNSESRVTFTVTDSSGTTVATADSPTANVSTATFTPSAAGTFTLTATETGTAANAYVVRVMQPWHDCPWCPYNNQ